MRPVLYLDIDDTLLSWAGGTPRGVPDTGPFLLWALERFEVRWLSRWCPEGEMSEKLVHDLAKMTDVDVLRLRSVPGCAWHDGQPKVNAIAWLEHLVVGRPFYWVENPGGLTPTDFRILEELGLADRYLPCDVTRDSGALDRVREVLEKLETSTPGAEAARRRLWEPGHFPPAAR